MGKEKDQDRFKWLGTYTDDLRKDKSFFNILTQGHLTYDKNLIFPSDRTVWLADSDGNPVYEEYTILTNLLKDKLEPFQEKIQLQVMSLLINQFGYGMKRKILF